MRQVQETKDGRQHNKVVGNRLIGLYVKVLILCYTILVLWGILDSFEISQDGSGETLAEMKISISADVHLLQHS